MQDFVEFVLGSFFNILTLQLPIQTSLSVVPGLPVSAYSGEKCGKFSKTSTPLRREGFLRGHRQWRMRDFPNGVATTRSSTAYYLANVCKNSMKLDEEQASIPSAPPIPQSASSSCTDIDYLLQ